MKEDLHLRCHYCIEYLTLADLEEGLVSISITAWPHTLRWRIEHAWKALRGHKFWYAEVLLRPIDVTAIRAWLDKGLGEGK